MTVALANSVDDAADSGVGLDAFRAGSPRAREALMSQCYRELRSIARRVLRADGDALLIQPTDLAHEAAIRVLGLDRIVLRDRSHFLALSARVMRQALLDEVRRYRARKRQAPPILTQWNPGVEASNFSLEGFDAALERLFAVDADRARVVELRFYAGLTMTEIAEATDSSVSTVERRWRAARAWLLAALRDGEA